MSAPTQTMSPLSDSADNETWWRFLLFFRWCLNREAFTRMNYLFLIVPIFVAGGALALQISIESRLKMGRALFETLSGIALGTVFMGGVRHASRAVCGELSPELRGLLRLTGISSSALLWGQSLSRWWTTFLSVLMLFPLALYARMHGGVTTEQWFATACWLALLLLLTAGFAMVAGVSSSGAANAEGTASYLAFLLMFAYHMLFWCTAVGVWLMYWLLEGTSRFAPNSTAGIVVEVAFNLAPVTQIYRAISDPDSFSLFSPYFWIHIPMGLVCIRLASIVMRNRYRSNVDLPETRKASRSAANAPHSGRPRCSDRPLFWKDYYLLSRAGRGLQFSDLLSVLGLLSVLASVAFGTSLPIALITLAVAPWIVAFHFDGLITTEFREQTWDSLMLLPLDPSWLLYEKVRAALWARRMIVLPVGAAIIAAGVKDPVAVVMALVISSMTGLVLMEVSVLSQFNRKRFWAGPIVGGVVITVIAAAIFLWALCPRWISFLLTIVITGTVACGFYSSIIDRMQHWSDD